MKKLMIAAAILAGSTSLVSAADLPGRRVAPAAVVVAPIFSWTGFYVGVHGGYGWGPGKALVNGGRASYDLSGGFGGGQVGYNYQINQFVIGLEADVSGGSISDSYTLGGAAAKSNIDYFGTIRGRAGFAIDKALIYATGGFAWANSNFKATAPGVSISSDKTLTGWTLGGGVEYAFMPNWSAKLEYLFTDYQRETYAASVVAGGVRLDNQVHSIKAGINYRF